MRRVTLLFLLLCVLSIWGCASTSQVIAPNRESLLKLHIGMSKEEAIAIMGTKPMTVAGGPTKFHTYHSSIKINNPYRSEILQGKDKTLEAVYYVTDVQRDDTSITDDELTPLIFEDGKLIGWGWRYLEEKIAKYEIRLR